MSSVITVLSIAEIRAPRGDFGGEKGGEFLFSFTAVTRRNEKIEGEKANKENS